MILGYFLPPCGSTWKMHIRQNLCQFPTPYIKLRWLNLVDPWFGKKSHLCPPPNYIQAMIESSDTSTTHTLPSSPIYSRFSLWNNGERATWMRRRRRRNISVYIDTSGSGGRGWVTHLLHRLVEEGAKVENVSTTKRELSFRFYIR